MEKEDTTEKIITNSPTAEKYEGDTLDIEKEKQRKTLDGMKSLNISQDGLKADNVNGQDASSYKIDENRDLQSKAQEEKSDNDIELDDVGDKISKSRGWESNSSEGQDVLGNKKDESRDMDPKVQEENSNSDNGQKDLGDKKDESRDIDPKVQEEKSNSNNGEEDLGDKKDESMHMEPKTQVEKSNNDNGQNNLGDKKDRDRELESNVHDETNQTGGEILGEEKETEPVFDGTEVPGMEANRSTSTRSLDLDPETQGSAWPEKAAAFKNLVKEKGIVAVSTVLRRLSGKKDEEGQDVPVDEDKEAAGSPKQSESKDVSQKIVERSAWNPLSYITMSRDVGADNKSEPREEVVQDSLEPIIIKGRIILYTRLGCQDCREVRLLLHRRRLGYIEVNIDIYPSRKLELEKISGSFAVPKVFFNEVLIGGLSELKGLDESGKLDEKIDYLIAETPSSEAPSPPLSGEDDVSNSGTIDDLAVIVLKMKETIVAKDRFYKMRRFTRCFLGSEAVDFLSEDQYLEREEAVELGRKLATKLFFRHILEENVFEDGNHLYRFLDDDPIVSSQCHNISSGIINVKPKPIIEIASRLRFLSYAIFEAYTSEDRKHVDYRSIHGSEEFARYLRIVEELQRIELQDMPREEKLAFFINLYNMMAIHVILVWGYPAGPLERRKLFGDFKYVVGGCTYSLSAIQNGILRGNQRPPYNLMKPFSVKDRRFAVALPYPEPLIHFALVCGTRSGPALRCYSPGNIDKELMDAARDFLSTGLTLDLSAKVASVSQILKWFSVDFGKNEGEVLKHASNYLEPGVSEALMELLANSQLKVIYQPYDWGINC